MWHWRADWMNIVSCYHMISAAFPHRNLLSSKAVLPNGNFTHQCLVFTRHVSLQCVWGQEQRGLRCSKYVREKEANFCCRVYAHIEALPCRDPNLSKPGYTHWEQTNRLPSLWFPHVLHVPTAASVQQELRHIHIVRCGSSFSGFCRVSLTFPYHDHHL